LWLPVVLAALLVVYLPGLGNALVFDDTLLTEAGFLAQYGSWREVRPRMLSYGSFVWVQQLLGEGWWKQRLVNLGLHVATVVALWALYRQVLRHIERPAPDDPVAPAQPPPYRSAALGVAVGFFALNPVAVYGVAYLVQRSIVMATLFVVLGLWCFMRALHERRPLLHLGAVACYVLAVMSKEHAVVAPLAALPLYVLVARPSRRRLAGLAAGSLTLMALAAMVLVQRYGQVLGKAFDEYSYVYLAQLARLDPDAEKNAFGLSIINQAYLFFHYALRWLVPASEYMSINLRPPFPVRWLTFPHVLGIVAYVATVVGSAWLLLRHRDWRALAGTSMLLAALLFTTEFATVWVQDPFVLYRSYLWAIGVPGIVFLLLDGMPGRVLGMVALVVGSLLVWQTSNRVMSLSTPERAWSDAIAKLPDDPRAVGRWFPYLNRGSEYVDANQFTLAMRDFEASSALGDLGMGAFNRGALLSVAGKHQEALAAFDRAEKEGYGLYNLWFQRGLATLALNRHAEAFQYFMVTRTRDPPSPTRELTLVHIAKLGLHLGKKDEAIAAIQQLLAIQPDHKEGRLLLALALVSKGDFLSGLGVAEALVKEGGEPLAHYARALAYHGLGSKREALADIDQAVRLMPGNPNLRQWQAKIRAMP
jgi:hypothetical protein